jgi:hypothetical protein
MIMILDMLIDELIQVPHRVLDLAIVYSLDQHIVDGYVGYAKTVALLEGVS